VTIYGDGGQTRDFVHVSDIARANALAASCPGVASSAFNICTGISTSLNRLLEIVRANIPSAPPPEYAAARPAEIRHSGADPAPARKALGFEARTKLEDGLPALLR
jgi:UDP-glucose 4-epimerase